MRYITPSILFVFLTLALVILFLGRYVHARRHPAGDLSWVREGRPDLQAAPRLTFAGKCHPMEEKDTLPLLTITLVYALSAFLLLGSLSSPRTVADFADGEPVTIELNQTVYLTKLRYFSGLGTGKYNVEISSNGLHWSTLWTHKDTSGQVTGYYWADAEGYTPCYAMTQSYNQVFKWQEIEPENPQNVRYIRITGMVDSGKEVLELSELALYSTAGEDRNAQGMLLISAADFGNGLRATGCDALFDEGSTVPGKDTWFTSTYFDEIYHARTAKEHIDGVYPYEITHPPLGKLIIGLGIRLFGMTPFGWRFSGTLFGVLMLPLLYIFLKNMFGKTVVAACGTTLFAAEFMHLTQTRIATIDTYAVFFILGMYFFLYRYLTLPAGTSFREGALPLLLSGLMWGLGAASKWTVFYAGVGLAIVYFMGFYQKLRDWPAEQRAQRGGWIAATLLWSVFCFVLMPFAIYVASYIPYALARQVPLSLGSMGESLALLMQNVLGRGKEGFVAQYIPQKDLAGVMASNQWYMFNYHNGVTSSHPYSSWWFQWIVDARPILYYMDNTVAGYTTRFAAFSNPVVCWAGLGAILICGAHSFRRRWSKGAFLGGLGLFSAWMIYKVQHTPNGVFDRDLLTSAQLTRNLFLLILCLVLYLLLCAGLLLAAPGYDGRAAFILVGYLAQLVPWMFIGRTTFEYHYFPSILFLVIAISYLINGLVEADRRWKQPVFALTGTAVGLYALFYPVLIGLQIPTWYEPLVKWIESWPF